MEQRKIIKCPTCGKRVLDIDADFAVLYIKCPHCRNEHRIEWQRKKAA
jgi:DNA-directed RNA polymerase subunit RPC12/RpoP